MTSSPLFLTSNPYSLLPPPPPHHHRRHSRFNPRCCTQNNTAKNARPNLASSLCNAADDFIDKHLQKALKPSIDPRFVLAGNYAPVKETPPTECTKVEGTLPACINGVYLRNGPNPLFPPRPGQGHHLNDGDGMLHALSIRHGRPIFCSRFVHTDKLVQELTAGRSLFPRVFAGFFGLAGMARGALAAARAALGVVDQSYASGLANTSVLFFGKKFMALGESGMPYAFVITQNGDICNVGRHDFGGKLKLGMTAHPKIDPFTGELFASRYAFAPPFLNFFRVDTHGEKHPDVPIQSMKRPVFVHDFAITGNYAIIPDSQIVVDPMEMILRKGSLIVCDSAKVPRLGVLPRYAIDDSEMLWFDVPGLNIVHTLNAWEEGDEELVLIAVNSEPVEYILEQNHLLKTCVEKIRLNLGSGSVSRKRLSSNLGLEFGVINPRYLTKKNRYAYMAIGAPFPKARGFAKLDFEKEKDGGECIVGSRIFGENCFGGEGCFVARSDEKEDDGYLVGFVHDESAGTSKLLVMDALSPTLEIVASVQLPARVPYGFHGLFVSQDMAFDQSL
ncbi:9-cis-epoxycarotenoid dioxygenase NCED1, chloroplastic [Cryptomeria japonica]|uniref:9-cis-epoxycarotenoid dioxygenase NCED1, chloroplastic n=1 Tax=Cryptomeria japonica TaxID=3369 RepID=UPI0027DA3183|nr:9-cis-epoxycarotenoid dioxygenase NCED1, chloroplastic [Cryptomeria japonica]